MGVTFLFIFVGELLAYCGWQFFHLWEVCLCIWESLYICGTVVFPFVGFLCAVIRAGHKTHLPFYVIFFFAGRVKRWLWSTAVLLMAAGLVYNLVLLSIRYFSYPILITVRLQTEPNLAFPAVTLCNMSPVRNSKWSEYQKQTGQTEEPVPKVKRSAKQTEQTQEPVTKVKRSAKQTEQTQEPVAKVKKVSQTDGTNTRTRGKGEKVSQTDGTNTRTRDKGEKVSQTDGTNTRTCDKGEKVSQTDGTNTRTRGKGEKVSQTDETDT